MRISNISFFQYQIKNNKNQSKPNVQIYNQTPDCFIKSSNSDIKSINELVPHKNVSFLCGIANISNEFERKFTRKFFKKLVREIIPDAYSDINLIPREVIDTFKSLGTLNKKSSIAIKSLKEFKDDMFPIEKQIFLILENLSKKHPDMTLQELIKLKFPQAEQSLIKQQSNILNKINLLIRKLPQNEFQQTRKIIQEAFDKIFEPNPIPEKRFRRKDFIIALNENKISDQKIKNKIMKIAEKLPRSSQNINAFIVKYSQPYKLRYNYKTQSYIRLTRNSEELGLRLLEPSVGTDEHIYPQTKFDKEFKEWLENKNSEDEFNKLKVSILTSRFMNELKSDTPIDEFILKYPEIPQRIQKQIDKLTEIVDKWAKQGDLQEASLLCDYIKVVKNEFDLRSRYIKLDIDELEKKLPTIKAKEQKSIEKKKNKRLKKTGHADNSHKEHNTNKDGSLIENRKVQKHSYRFSK